MLLISLKRMKQRTSNYFAPCVYNNWNGERPFINRPPVPEDVANLGSCKQQSNNSSIMADNQNNSKLYVIMTAISTAVSVIAELIKQIFC